LISTSSSVPLPASAQRNPSPEIVALAVAIAHREVEKKIFSSHHRIFYHLVL
jgi:hypothetical protein